MRHNVTYSADVKLVPYWWEEAPISRLPEVSIPKAVDAVVIGAGYSGLSAALTLARAGRSVLVAEAGEAGEGASTRNGGAVGESLRISFASMISKFGLETAKAFYSEVRTARRHLEHLIEQENIACHYRRVGRFIGCHTPKFYDSLARDLELRKQHLDFEAEMVPRAEQHRVVGTDRYYGGRLILTDGNLQPALLHRGLLERAMGAGAVIATNTRVTRMERNGSLFTVTAGGREVKARDVIVGTNGYTGNENSWLRRRLIPIQSQIIATEPLPTTTIERLIPKGRQLGDTCNLHYYYRTSPDGTRILFGGRAGAHAINDPRRSGRHLYQRLIDLFPELAGTKVTHSWAGLIAYTFDHLQHVGTHEGIHYAAGCCGSGVVMLTWLGHQAAVKALNRGDEGSVFDRPFQTRPLYNGTPWFLPAAVFYYGARDRLGM